ncbi:MAG: DUF502 domain-containing protein [Planctomycetota bacterium]
MDRTQARARRQRSRAWNTFKALIRTRLTAGLITILPILATIWIVLVVFRWLRDASRWVVVGVLENGWFQHYVFHLGGWRTNISIEELMQAHPLLDWGISLFSVGLTFALLYMIGLFTANVLGRRLLGIVDQVADRVPLVKTIYGTLKQILKLFSGEQTRGFKRVVLVPFPNEKTRSVAFVTNTMRDARTGEELCACFIPSTPNPTTGFVFMLRRSDVVEVDWTVEDAIKVIMSGGVLSPMEVTLLTGGRAGDSPGDHHAPSPAGAAPLDPRSAASLPPAADRLL